MRGVVVQDDVDLQVRRDSGIDAVEEFDELFGAMPALAGSQDLAGRGIQGGEEGEGAMALAVMRPALDLARPHRQQRCGTVQRLYLRLLIDAQD